MSEIFPLLSERDVTVSVRTALAKWIHPLIIVIASASIWLTHSAPLHSSERSAINVVTKVNEHVADLLGKYRGTAEFNSQVKIQLSDDLEVVLKRYLDIEAVSQAVLGVRWRSATRAQRKEFQSVFTRYLAEKYSSNLPEFAGLSFDVFDAEELKKNHFVVDVEFTTSNGNKSTTRWYVLRRSGRSRIVNLVIGSNNVLSIERKVIRSLLEQRGGNIDRLNQYLPHRYY
ncbi:MAG: ABC transporter substrate-binding protein [Rhodobacteraceae bacterium]|nr:ABC transporter substrate-binding protein [Paracoccaceae bacterium]